MVFKEKRIILKDGKECILKSPEIADAGKLLEYLKTTSAETDFMLRYPEEVTMTLENEEGFIGSIRESPNSIMISAFIDGRLAGNASLNCAGNWVKTRHRATFGIAILKEFWNLGLGKALLTEILDSASQAGFEQVELEVSSMNYPAIKLYEQFGFKKYGTRDNAFKLKDGKYCSEDLMMKQINGFKGEAQGL